MLPQQFPGPQMVPQSPPSDQGFLERLASNPVLGMPLSEALLRFGSGVLSGQSFNQGLAQAGSNLVQGAESARRMDFARTERDRAFQQQRQLQDERLRTAARLQAEMPRPAATPFQRGAEVFRDPETGTHYVQILNAATGAQELRMVGSNTALPPDQAAVIAPRLQRAAQEIRTGEQVLQRQVADDYNTIFREGVDARDTIRDIDGAMALLRPEPGRTINTGAAIPDRILRAFTTLTGVPIGANTPSTLAGLRIYLGSLNQAQRAELLRGLQPVSNAEFTTANMALADIENAPPEAIMTILSMQRRRAERALETNELLLTTTPEQIARTGLPVATWLEAERRRRANPPFNPAADNRQSNPVNEQGRPGISPINPAPGMAATAPGSPNPNPNTAPAPPGSPVVTGRGFSVTPLPPQPGQASPAPAPSQGPPTSPQQSFATEVPSPNIPGVMVPNPAAQAPPGRQAFPPGPEGDRMYRAAIESFLRNNGTQANPGFMQRFFGR